MFLQSILSSALLIQSLTYFVLMISADSNTTCVPKCDVYANQGDLIPGTEVDTSDGALCYYYSTCSTMGLGFHYCQYNVSCSGIPRTVILHIISLKTDGSLNTAESGGETCGITYEICRESTRIVCEPPPGVSCTTSCPLDDNNNWPLDYSEGPTDVGTLECGYGPGTPVPRNFCEYYEVSIQ